MIVKDKLILSVALKIYISCSYRDIYEYAVFKKIAILLVETYIRR